MNNKLFNEKIYWFYKGNKFYWNDFEFGVMYSYLYRFEQKNKLDFLDGESLNLKGDIMLSLQKYIENLITDLLDDCYEEPSHKNLSTRISNYEKIEINGKKYHVNYRTTSYGIIIYSMYCFLNTLKEANTTNEEIIIKWK